MDQVDRVEAVSRYRDLRATYQALASRLSSLIEDLCSPLKVHVVTARAKDEGSFRQKAFRQGIDSEGYLYSDPLTEIEDLAGVRVICFSNSQVDEVCNLIEANFNVLGSIDKAKELNAAGRVGYVSKHFVVKISDVRAQLPEYIALCHLKCEIQVRTVFQHAWAEVEHRLQYKDDSPKPELRARFQALAGLVQIADREFDQLFDYDKELSEQLKDAVKDVQALDDDPEPTQDEDLNHKLSIAASLFGLSPKVLVSNGEYEKAIRTYDELISLQPRQSWHYVGRAKAKILKGDFSGASSDINMILKIGGADARLPEARARLETAVRFASLEPGDNDKSTHL